MEKKDIERYLADWGWRIEKDEVGDKSAYLSLIDKEISIGWTLRGLYRRATHKTTYKLTLTPSISTKEFSKIFNNIHNKPPFYNFRHILTNLQHYSLEELEINVEHLQRLTDEAVAWAKAQDIENILNKHASLPTDTFGSNPLKLLTSLVLLGDVKKLKYFKDSFEKGERLGFVPYITKDYINRAYSAALERENKCNNFETNLDP